MSGIAYPVQVTGPQSMNIVVSVCVPVPRELEEGFLREIDRSCSLPVAEGEMHLIVRRDSNDRIVGAECKVNDRTVWTLKTTSCNPTPNGSTP